MNTEWIRRKARYMGPVFAMGLVWIATPFLITLDEGMDNLAEMPIKSSYDWYRPWVKAGIVALAALGSFMDRTLDHRRRKITEEETKQYGLSEEEWARQETQKATKK